MTPAFPSRQNALSVCAHACGGSYYSRLCVGVELTFCFTFWCCWCCLVLLQRGVRRSLQTAAVASVCSTDFLVQLHRKSPGMF